MFYPILVRKENLEVSTVSEKEYAGIYDGKTKKFDDAHVKSMKKKYESSGYYFILPTTDTGAYGRWRWGYGYETIRKLATDAIVKVNGDQIVLQKKQRPLLGEMISKKPKSVFYKPEYSSGNGTAQLKKLFGRKVFNNPKPIDLIRDFIKIGSNKDSIVMDSFAGTGTTGHAVMDLNKEDKGNRRFILLQLTEASEVEPEKNVCKDITRERLRLAIEKNDYHAGYKYLRVGNAIDAETLLSGNLPSFHQFAKHVFYLCTGETLEKESTISEADYLVGHHGRMAIHLVYKADFEELTKLALNLDLAEAFRDANAQRRIIVYAPACFLGEEDLERLQIDFVSIPYNLFERKG